MASSEASLSMAHRVFEVRTAKRNGGTALASGNHILRAINDGCYAEYEFQLGKF